MADGAAAKPADTGPGADMASGPLALVRSLRVFDQRIQRAEVILACVVFLTMTVLAFAQVFLRNFQGGIWQPVSWLDVVNYHLVIWVGVIGASVATAEGRHISIEALPKVLGERGKRRLDVVVNLSAMFVVGLLLVLSLHYIVRTHTSWVNTEKEHLPLFVIESLGNLKVFRWPFLSIVPVGLFLMCWRFLLRVFEAFVLPDDEYRRDELEGVDPEALEAQEAVTATMLLEHEERSAAETGRTAELDSESARALVEEALHSDRVGKPGSSRRDGTPGSGKPDAVISDDDVPQKPQKPQSFGPGPMKSTDEIPIYRDLGNDADLEDPELRHGDPDSIMESTDSLEPHVYAAAAEALEAVADTERVHRSRDDDEEDVSEESPPKPESGGGAE